MKSILAISFVVFFGCSQQRPSSAGPISATDNITSDNTSIRLQGSDGQGLARVVASRQRGVDDEYKVDIYNNKSKNYSFIFGGEHGGLRAMILRENGKVRKTVEYRSDGSMNKITIYTFIESKKSTSFTVFTYGESGELLGKQSGSTHDG